MIQLEIPLITFTDYMSIYKRFEYKIFKTDIDLMIEQCIADEENFEYFAIEYCLN